MQKELSRSNMKRNWFTISSLVSRDFKLKYRRSVLGVLWSVLNPLLMMLVMTFVFSSIFRFSVENYPLYVVLGNVLFALMSDSTTTAMYSIIDSSSLIKKIRIEKLIFPIEKVLFQLVNFCISLIAVAIVMVVMHVAPKLASWRCRCSCCMWFCLVRASVWRFRPWRYFSAMYAIFGVSP